MTRKDPDGTRGRILEAAFAEVHANGFRAASLDSVLRAAGVTKGALYHHFPSKDALGHALIGEVLGGHVRRFTEGLEAAEDPVGWLQGACLAPPALPIRLGCPLNNLAQELAAVDEPLRLRIEEVFRAWRSAIARALARGQERGQVRREADPAALAAFVLAALEGSISLAKSARDEGLFASNMRLLAAFLETLRPAAEAVPAVPLERKARR